MFGKFRGPPPESSLVACTDRNGPVTCTNGTFARIGGRADGLTYLAVGWFGRSISCYGVNGQVFGGRDLSGPVRVMLVFCVGSSHRRAVQISWFWAISVSDAAGTDTFISTVPFVVPLVIGSTSGGTSVVRPAARSTASGPSARVDRMSSCCSSPGRITLVRVSPLAKYRIVPSGVSAGP